ncbi:hypothetical protein HPB47_015172 [Ixodes persulcatus]|uniref:Uncharacterized protein n=1 Tax=Ixodes persulcatus TaxID=34615 RepID=A0AC60QU71_IXOPE|nr:hypothetical protein HPB47_015172 [Ixodes persulcatus]
MVSLENALCVATLNVRGLAARRRQQQLYRLLTEHDLDIIAIQETKVESKDQTDYMVRPFQARYEVCVSHAVGFSAGCCLFLRKSLGAAVQTVTTCPVWELHRRHSSNDQLGNAESLEESGANQRGLVVRGTHRVFVGTIEESWPRLRRRALQLVYRPLVAFAPPAFFRTFERTKYSGLLSPLPGTVHVLTLERVSSGQVLLRLEHLGFQNKTIQVNVTKLFRFIALTDVRAVTLGGNQFIEEASRLQWRTNQFGTKRKFSAPKIFTTPAKDTIVTLLPRQIVTILASLKMY